MGLLVAILALMATSVGWERNADLLILRNRTVVEKCACFLHYSSTVEILNNSPYKEWEAVSANGKLTVSNRSLTVSNFAMQMR